MSKRFVCMLSLMMACLFSVSAKVEYKTTYSYDAFASFAAGDHTPFWIVSGKRGKVSLRNNSGNAAVGFKNEMKWRSFSFSTGIEGVAAYRHVTDFNLQQLYMDAAYKKLHLTIGMKEYDNSLADNALGTGDLLFSWNARNIPEINVNTDYIAVPYTGKIVSFKFDFALGKFLDSDYINAVADRNSVASYTRNVLLHHKSLTLKLGDPSGHFPLDLLVSMNHAAEWAGTTTLTENGASVGRLPHGFKNFMRIVAGKEGGNDAMMTDQDNALGNHLGTLSVRVDYKRALWSVSGYWSHLFDDGSGMNIGKWFRDGLLGVEVALHQCKWVNKLLYEYLHTTDQSGPLHFLGPETNTAVGGDDYYNNGVYMQGWSHFGKAIGNSLLSSPEYFNCLGFRNNRVKAHHFAIQGNFTSAIDYDVKLTHSCNYGTHGNPFLSMQRVTSVGIRLGYLLSDKLGCWRFNVQVAGDKSRMIGDNIGISMGISRQGIL